jgi:hypothetical protein
VASYRHVYPRAPSLVVSQTWSTDQDPSKDPARDGTVERIKRT